MSRLKVFRLLIITSVISYVIWFFLPYLPIEHSRETLNLLAASGYGAASITQHPFVYISIVVAKLMASLGLFLFLSWGRWLFVGVVTISVVLVPFSGVVITAPLDGLFGAFAGLIDGAIIALSFSFPIAQYWRKDE